MSVNTWEHFFKPEVRTAGRTLFSKGKVSLSQPSDTEIVVYIRATPGFKVILKTASVESQAVTVSCSCPIAKKDKFCKHAWAGLLAADDKYPDFFEAKTELERAEIPAAKTGSSAASSAKSAEFAAKQAAYSQKQTDYRKEQYQKQKERQKAYKESKKGVAKKPEFPKAVERALSFFADNGMDLSESLDKQTVSAAKKKLARVFHPDLGGDHEEIVELNNCTDILIEYISKQ
ncbi:MAG: hypothetical protein B7Y39_07765 [Bdellovibrio sp. 28-41-41]|nr:MAG: hypothetical protein B7Y39_07765 [Bdellovibrio sp. 28-41-41]